MSIILPGPIQEIARQFQQQGGFARTRLAQDEEFAPGMIVHLSDSRIIWQEMRCLVRLLEDKAPGIGESFGLLVQSWRDERRSMQRLFKHTVDPKGSHFCQKPLAVLATCCKDI